MVDGNGVFYVRRLIVDARLAFNEALVGGGVVVVFLQKLFFVPSVLN